VLQRPVQSGATLIVAPHSITHQWVDEVLRHVAVDALQIFVRNFCRCTYLTLQMFRYDLIACSHLDVLAIIEHSTSFFLLRFTAL